ncbi:MAG: DUF6090 family protein [Pseudomonadota bacterium]
MSVDTDQETTSSRLDAIRAGPGPKRFAWLLSEFVVVVMGVLVAITIDGWWSDRQDRDRETVYLQQLANDLARSEEELVEVSARIRGLAVSAANVTKAFWDPALRERPELLNDLINPHRSTRYLPITGTAEALVNSGNIDLLQSAPLRSGVIEYLEDVEAAVRNIERFDETYYRPARFLGTAVSVPILTVKRLEAEGVTPADALSEESLPLFPFPGRIESKPFEVDLEAIFEDRGVFERYHNLLVAHRNQHYRYEELREYGRRLLALLAEAGIEPTVSTQPVDPAGIGAMPIEPTDAG